MASHTFTAGKLTIEFVEQDDKDRVELGERFEKVIFVPANANGHFKNFHWSKMPKGYPGYQIAHSAWLTGMDAVFAGYPTSRKLHLYSRPDENENGCVGWIHRDQLGDADVVQVGKFTVNNTYTVNPKTHLREYGAQYEWCKLFEISKTWFSAGQDDTFSKDKYGQKLPLPWGSLRHTHLMDLASGTRLETYPMFRRVYNEDGTYWLDTEAQDQAIRLFTTLTAIKKSELTYEQAKEQLAAHRDEMRHNYWDLEAGIKSGEITPADVQETKENAVRYVTGQAVQPTGIIVNYTEKGTSYSKDLAELPSGRYQCSVGSFIRTYPSDQAGRLNIRKLVRENNGNLKVEKVS